MDFVFAAARLLQMMWTLGGGPCLRGTHVACKDGSLYSQVLGSMTHNGRKVEATQAWLKWGVHIDPHGVLFSLEKEGNSDTATKLGHQTL